MILYNNAAQKMIFQAKFSRFSFFRNRIKVKNIKRQIQSLIYSGKNLYERQNDKFFGDMEKIHD